MQDVIIVGGGIAGLVAGAFAARAGARTLVLEANAEVGGRAATRDVGEFRFNVGPHALYLAGAAMRTLGELGIDPPGAPPARTGNCYVQVGKLHPLSFDLAALAESTLLDDAEKPEFGRAFHAIATGFSGDPGDTVAQALERLTFSPAVRAMVAAQVRVSTYSNAPNIADAAAVFDQLRLTFGGVRYMDGGWKTMVQALTRAARDAGAEIRTRQRAIGVTAEGGGWRVACGGGVSSVASAVVLTTAPRQAFELARLKLTQKLCPVRVASLDVALSRLPCPERTFALGLDEPTYYSVHSASAQGLAPPGGALLHVSQYLEPSEMSSGIVRSQLEGLLDLLQPGWREVLVHARWLPQVNVTHDQPQAAFGGLGGRHRVTLGSGLFLAGDWIGDEGMLADAAFASGRAAANLASRHALAAHRLA